MSHQAHQELGPGPRGYKGETAPVANDPAVSNSIFYFGFPWLSLSIISLHAFNLTLGIIGVIQSHPTFATWYDMH